MCSIDAQRSEPAVEVVGLVRRFGARTAVTGLSLVVAAGQIAGLIGANGGGKTTSLRLLAGLLAPDAGSGRVLGHDLRRPDRRIRGDVGYMAQRLALYAHLSVFENLRFRAEVYGLPKPRDAARRAVADFGLGPYAQTSAERLSGGWARMAQLAAALIHSPRLVLLDEPSAGLDAAARQAVWRRIASLAGAGAAVVIATHDLAEAERCSQVSVLAGGQMLAQGAPQAITRASAGQAHAIVGAGAIGLAEAVTRVPGVVAAYPMAAELRVLSLGPLPTAIGAWARAAGCELVRREPTLEDATLVLAHGDGLRT